jgi:hypothetical protein
MEKIWPLGKDEDNTAEGFFTKRPEWGLWTPGYYGSVGDFSGEGKLNITDYNPMILDYVNSLKRL